MRELEYARRKRGRLGRWCKVLGIGLILGCCAWPGISLGGLATAAAGLHPPLSASPCDTLQEVRRKNEDLRKLLKKTPWPKLKYFWANGRSYSLPLRSGSREPSHRAAKARLEYLAGFFDGDGCVSCPVDLSGCQLSVAQSYDQADILMLFLETFGGSIARQGGGMGLRKPAPVDSIWPVGTNGSLAPGTKQHYQAEAALVGGPMAKDKIAKKEMQGRAARAE